MQYCLPEPLKTVNPKGGFLVRPPFCTFPQTSGNFFVAKSGLKWVRSQLYQGNFCPRKKSKTHGIFSQISDFTVTKYSMKLKCCQWPKKFLPPQTAKAGRLIESVPAFAAALTASPTASSLVPPAVCRSSQEPIQRPRLAESLSCESADAGEVGELGEEKECVLLFFIQSRDIVAKPARER